MAEFLVVFVVTFAVIAGVTAALVFGKTPVYRPTVDDVQSLLTRLLEQQLPEGEWSFFVQMPIVSDEALEKVRKACQEIDEAYALRPKAGMARLKEEGLIKIRYWLNKLEQSGSRSF